MLKVRRVRCVPVFFGIAVFVCCLNFFNVHNGNWLLRSRQRNWSDASSREKEETAFSWDEWRRVKEREIYVHGAYLDSRQFLTLPVPSVVVFAAINTTETRLVYCHALYQSKNKQAYEIADAPLTLINLPVGVDMAGVGVGLQRMLRCKVDKQRTPIAVRITSDYVLPEIVATSISDFDFDNEWIMVNKAGNEPEVEMSWCTGPIYGEYPNAQMLIEQLEWAKLQGYAKVYIYVFETTDPVKSVLRFYVEQGFVEVISWSIAGIFDQRLPYYGQMLTINDCLYRNVGRSRMLAMHDTDERLIDPSGGSVLAQAQWLCDTHPSASSFYFNMTHYCHNQSMNGTLGYHLRAYIPTTFYLGKLIAIPERVVMLDVHSVAILKAGFRQVRFDNKPLFLAHFRQREAVQSWIDDADDALERVSIPLREPVKLASQRIFRSG